MSASFTLLIRGKEREVVIDRDYGYEPDTNAHEVDWHVEGLSSLTTDEEEYVMSCVYSFLVDQL